MNDSFSPTKGILNQFLQCVPLPLIPVPFPGEYAQEVQKARQHKLFQQQHWLKHHAWQHHKSHGRHGTHSSSQ